MIIPILARFWPYIAVVLLGGLLYLSVRHNGALSVERDHAIQTANENAATAQHAVAEASLLQTITDTATAEKTVIRTKSDTRRKAINHAAPTDDGPLAVLLRDELNSLRADGDEGGTTPSTQGVGKSSGDLPRPVKARP